jgi:hypothetical protein
MWQLTKGHVAAYLWAGGSLPKVSSLIGIYRLLKRLLKRILKRKIRKTIFFFRGFREKAVRSGKKL